MYWEYISSHPTDLHFFTDGSKDESRVASAVCTRSTYFTLRHIRKTKVATATLFSDSLSGLQAIQRSNISHPSCSLNTPNSLPVSIFVGCRTTWASRAMREGINLSRRHYLPLRLWSCASLELTISFLFVSLFDTFDEWTGPLPTIPMPLGIIPFFPLWIPHGLPPFLALMM